MNTECTPKAPQYHSLGRREVIGEFNGGKISSVGGALLLRELEKRIKIVSRLSTCFTDYRDAKLIEHDVESLLKQRVFGIVLGYEDLNDHDRLRNDPLLALVCDKADPEGDGQFQQRDKGNALAGKSTLNRLELSDPEQAPDHRYKKIVANPEAMDDLMVELFLESFAEAPDEIILDIDATDDPLHGEQEDRFFHGYYGHYCYLPLLFSVMNTCCVPVCALPTRMVLRERSRS